MIDSAILGIQWGSLTSLITRFGPVPVCMRHNMACIIIFLRLQKCAKMRTLSYHAHNWVSIIVFKERNFSLVIPILPCSLIKSYCHQVRFIFFTVSQRKGAFVLVCMATVLIFYLSWICTTFSIMSNTAVFISSLAFPCESFSTIVSLGGCACLFLSFKCLQFSDWSMIFIVFSTSLVCY